MPTDNPTMQLAVLLAGVGMLWWEVRSIRRKVAEQWDHREMILAHRLKSLVASIFLAAFGASYLLASGGLISSGTARHVFTGAAFVGLCAVLYLLVRKAPHWVWRWLGPPSEGRR